jgi:predicted nucleic acid-binding protein
MLFVLDCSVAINWCVEDENNIYAEAVYEIIIRQNQALVPAFFWLEISNVLWVAEKRNRNTREKTDQVIKLLQNLPILIDAKPITESINHTLNVARQYNLAAYLELAIREGLLLATTDDKLANAAKQLGIFIKDPN